MIAPDAFECTRLCSVFVETTLSKDSPLLAVAAIGHISVVATNPCTVTVAPADKTLK